MNNGMPYESVIACKMGEEAVLQAILKHYEPMILDASQKKVIDNNGITSYVVDDDVKAYIISELTMAIMMKYDPTRIPRERRH